MDGLKWIKILLTMCGVFCLSHMMCEARVFVWLVLAVCAPLFSGGFSPCPCEDPALCDPIITTPKREIFTFSLSDSPGVWANYNWSLITTVVAARSVHDQLMCLAHKHGARIVTIANYSPTSALANATHRQIWIKQKQELIYKHHLDGINFDFEDEIPKDKIELRDGYTALVSETRQTLRELNPFMQVTVDVAWSPSNIDLRYYDYVGLANAADFLFVMSYDERSQIFGPCVAAANSGYPTTSGGIQEYLQLSGVPGSKLVLGVPWYGYDYACVTLYKNDTCVIPFHPWRGVNCSDAAGTQYDYVGIINLLRTNASAPGRLWDTTSLSPYFNFKSTSDHKMHQIWYDDPESLKIKYRLVGAFNLRGAGMWQADTLDNSDTPQGRQQRQEMWSALAVALQ